jgi:hypothetical protein
MDVYVLGFYGNISQKGTYLHTQVLVYGQERAKTASGKPLSTKTSKARKSGQGYKGKKGNRKVKGKGINKFLTNSIQ